MNGDKHFARLALSQKFRTTFGMALQPFIDITGFDVIAFDEAIKTPDGTSTRNHVHSLGGDDAVNLILELMK